MHSENLLMVPAENDFRAANFSQRVITGAISADPQEDTAGLETRLKEDALKTALTRHGLKSVKTRDTDTVVSYEGAVMTPVRIVEKSFLKERNQYQYKVQMDFSPIAFPDTWESRGLTHSIKKAFHNFIDLFR